MIVSEESVSMTRLPLIIRMENYFGLINKEFSDVR